MKTARKYVSVAVAMLFAGTALAQQNDPVIMTINGQDVLRSEFEYSYNKNNSEGVIDKKTVDEYVDLFINYKLKVAAAMDEKLDTMTSFKTEFATYRDQQIRPSFVTDEAVEAEAHKIYNNTKNQIGPDGLIRPAHILLMVNQQSTKEELDEAKERIDSIYGVLKNGADFGEIARKFSQDPGSAPKGGELPWLSKGQLVKEFEDVAFGLQDGEMSEPVQSPYGWHIIKMNGRKQLEPFEELREDIMKFIDARGLRERIATTVIDSLVAKQGVTKEQLMDERAAEMQAKDSDLDNLVREYHDGLLLYEISNREVWEKAASDNAGLEKFFKKNKKNYNWDEPRFKGMVFHVKDPADVKAVKNCVKGLEFGKWAEKLRSTFNNDSIIRIRVEKGIFKKGDNAFIDSIVFKKDTITKPVKGYPIDDVFGKVLKKGPENYEDVRGLVTADYQEALEKAWVEELRRRYPFTVNKEVLDTVNKH